jgi:hypothetical protein
MARASSLLPPFTPTTFPPRDDTADICEELQRNMLPTTLERLQKYVAEEAFSMTHGPWTWRRAEYDACIAEKDSNFPSSLDQVWSLLESCPRHTSHNCLFIVQTLWQQQEIGPHTAALFTRLLKCKAVIQLEASQLQSEDTCITQSLLRSPPSAYRSLYFQQLLTVKALRQELKQLPHLLQAVVDASKFNQ